MTQITVEKTAEDSASKSLRVTVPVDRVREAEAKALKYYVQRARLPGFRPGKAPGGRRPQAVRRRHPPVGARGGDPRELGDGPDAPSRSSRSPIPPSGTSSSRRAARSSSSSWSRCGPRSSSSAPAASGSSAGWRRWPTARSRSSSRGCRSRRRPGFRSRAPSRRPARWSGWRSPRSTSAGAGAAQPYDLVLGQNQAIPDLEERIMTLLPGEQADAEVKFPDDHPDESRRGQTRRVRVTLHDVKRQELPAARRRLRARGGRLREPRRAARGGPAGPGARGRPRGRRPGAAGADPAGRRGQQRAGAGSLVHRLMHGYAEMYRVPPGAAAAVRAAVPRGRRGAGPARPGARRGGRGQRPPGHRGRAGPAGRRAGRGAGRARPASSTATCRRPTGCPSSSAPSPRRRRSPGSSSSPQSTR